jgi:hypothetical protein
MDSIRQYKKLIIGSILGFLLFCCILAALMPTNTQQSTVATDIPVFPKMNTAVILPTETNTPTPTATPTIIPTMTPNEISVYNDKIRDWTNRLLVINNVVVSILSGETVPAQQNRNAAVDLVLLRREIHATIPPPLFASFHMHYSNAVDNLYNAIIALAENRLSDAITLLDISNKEMIKAKESVP